jgi:hypothetical protein
MIDPDVFTEPRDLRDWLYANGIIRSPVGFPVLTDNAVFTCVLLLAGWAIGYGL